MRIAFALIGVGITFLWGSPSFATTIKTEDPEQVAAKARSYLWQGSFTQAEPLIESLLGQYPNNPDYRLLKAQSAFYQNKRGEAKNEYQQILSSFPNYTDAREGLERLQKTAPRPPAWRLDTGYGLSFYRSGTQPDWNRQSAQLSYRFANKAVVFGRSERFDQFDNIDTMIEAGGAYPLSEKAAAEGSLAITPNAEFKPTTRLNVGLSHRIVPAVFSLGPLWTHYRFKEDWYSALQSSTHKAGFSWDIIDDWTLSTDVIYTHQSTSKTSLGCSTRIDMPLFDSIKTRFGYATAPEIDESIIEPVDTLFYGLTLPITETVTLRFDASHENRKKSSDRNNIDVGLAFVF